MTGEVQPSGGRGLAPDRALEFVRSNTRPGTTALCPEIRLHQVDRLTALWQVGERDLGALGVEVPFWAVAWPGGQALARHLLDTPAEVRGRRVLDVGTGSGICAIAAALAGAGTTRAMDPDPVAIAALGLNTVLNRVCVQAQTVDPLVSPPPTDVDVVLAADLWYERCLARAVTPWLRRAAAAGARVLCGDPGRDYLPRDGLVELARHAVPTSRELERDAVTEARVFRLLPGAAA